MSQQSIARLLHLIDGEDLERSLRVIAGEFPGRVVLSSSFSLEDQVITHTIRSNGIPINIFTLDTGRLFPETYALWSRTNARYGGSVDAYYPNNEKVEAYVNEYGPDAFYESSERRKECCHIRKVEPLRRALRGNDVWITGVRAEHSESRETMERIEWDEANGIIKYHPLLHWSTDEVRAFIDDHGIPYNPLHDNGFVSIGCAPCTRAILPGENFRAGRWWWEDGGRRECGLHERGDER